MSLSTRFYGNKMNNVVIIIWNIEKERWTCILNCIFLTAAKSFNLSTIRILHTLVYCTDTLAFAYLSVAFQLLIQYWLLYSADIVCSTAHYNTIKYIVINKILDSCLHIQCYRIQYCFATIYYLFGSKNIIQ